MIKRESWLMCKKFHFSQTQKTLVTLSSAWRWPRWSMGLSGRTASSLASPLPTQSRLTSEWLFSARRQIRSESGPVRFGTILRRTRLTSTESSSPRCRPFKLNWPHLTIDTFLTWRPRCSSVLKRITLMASRKFKTGSNKEVSSDWTTSNRSFWSIKMND